MQARIPGQPGTVAAEILQCGACNGARKVDPVTPSISSASIITACVLDSRTRSLHPDDARSFHPPVFVSLELVRKLTYCPPAELLLNLNKGTAAPSVACAAIMTDEQRDQPLRSATLSLPTPNSAPELSTATSSETARPPTLQLRRSSSGARARLARRISIQERLDGILEVK